MFGIGDTEFVLILIFAFLLFGPDKLPSMGRTIGRGIRQFRQASDSVTKVVKSEVLDPITQSANATAGAATGVAAGAAAAPVTPEEDQAALAERPKETFAERRARLAAEKAAHESEAAGDEPPETGAVAPIASEAEVVEVEESEPVAPTIASMWGLSSSAPEAAPAPEAASALEPVASEPAPEAAEVGDASSEEA